MSALRAIKALTLADCDVRRLSLKNQQAVNLQVPGASYVAGFKDWLRLGRVVRKGETAIRILAPLTRKGEAEPYAWRSVAVFDLSQTVERKWQAV